MSNVIDNLSININTKTDTKGIDDLIKKIKALKIAKQDINKGHSMTAFLTDLNKAGSKIDSLKKKIKNIGKIKPTKIETIFPKHIETQSFVRKKDEIPKKISNVTDLSRFNKNAMSSKKAIDGINNSLEEAKGQTKAFLNNLRKGIPLIRGISNQIKGIKSPKFDFDGLKGFRKLKTMGTRLKGALSGVGVILLGTTKGINNYKRSLLSASKLSYKMAKIPFAHLAKGILETKKRWTGLARSFARVGFYRMVRWVLSNLTQLFKEGVNNAYAWSQANGSVLANSIDRMSSAMLYLKNSIAAAAAPLINAFAPAIDIVINKIVAFLNMINQFFAKITGAKTWMKATKQQTKFANGVSAGASKIKKANKSIIASFDELNVIEKDSPDSSDGGGGATAGDVGSMFETMKLDPNKFKWIDDFKKAISKDNWEGAGAILGEQVNNLLNSIDWKAWGNKLGLDLNNAVDFGIGFLKNIEWEKHGGKFAEGMNTFFNTVNWERFGKLVGISFSSIGNVIYGWAKNFDWKLVGKSFGYGINGFVVELNLSKVVDGILTILNGVLDTVTEFIKTINWGQLGEKIGKGLSAIDVKNTIPKIANLIGNVFIGAFKLLTDIIKNLNVTKIVGGLIKGIANAIRTFPYLDVISAMWELLKTVNDNLDPTRIVTELVPTIIEAGKGIISDLFTYLTNQCPIDVKNFVSEIPTMFKTAMNNVSSHLGNVWDKIVAELGDGLKSNLNKAWNGIKDSAFDIFNSIGNIISGVWNNIKTSTSEIWGSAKKSVTDVWNYFSENVSSIFSDISRTIGDTWDGIKSKTSTVWNTVKSTLNDTWNSFKDSAGEKWNTLKSTIVSKWDEIKSNTSEVWTNIKNKLGSIWDSISTKSSKSWKDIKEGIGSIWDNIHSKIRTVINGILSNIEGFINGIISGINSAIRALNKLNIKIPKGIPGIGGKSFGINISEIASVSLRRYEKGGFPDEGQMFIARESGPELVGNIGNKNAVVNNQQIIDGIKQGVIEAMLSIPTKQNEEREYSFNVYLDGKQITANVEKRQKERGVSIYSGGILNGQY